jgi:hypothetical protein
MNGSNGINRKAAVISAVSAVLVIGLVVGLVFLLAGDKKDNGAAQATAPGVPAGGIVSAASTGTAGASGSSSDSATGDSASFLIASGGRIVARVTMNPIGPGDHYLKVDFDPEGEPDSSGHECLSIYDPIANHEYVLAEYVAGRYYLHANAVNCTYTITLEQQF